MPDTPGKSVFINCPFDRDYVSLLRPLLYTVLRLGFQPRIASERSDSGELRLSKIVRLMKESDYAIHDLSRMRSGEIGEVFRLNMAFELGINYGYRSFGRTDGRPHLLILEKNRFDYQRAMSDISGMDIKHHGDDPAVIVRRVRNWFLETVGVAKPLSPTAIWYSFNDYMARFYDERVAEGFSKEDLDSMPVPELISYMREEVGTA